MSLFGVKEKFDSKSLTEPWHYIIPFLAKASLVGSDTSSSEEQSENDSGVMSSSVFSSIIFFKSKLL